jgi:hypothetical protein
MIERQPYLPRFMAGGPGNPLGARALYLGKTLYRIHGTNQPSTIGSFVNLRGGNAYPSLIRKTEKKPLRVFLEDSSGDLDDLFADLVKE